MKYSTQEIGIILFSLDNSERRSPDGRFYQRTFAVAQAFDVSQISKQISVLRDENGKIEGEHELDFSTSEKKLILDCMNREWPRLDMDFYLSLHEKLEGKVKEEVAQSKKSKE